MSASIIPTRCPASASATARFTATVDFPTPPFPDETAMIRPRCGSSIPAGAAPAVVAAPAPAPGGPCVAVAGPAGSVTWIRAGGSTPGTPSTAFRTWRTRVAGSSRPSRKVKETSPASVTARSRTRPAVRTSPFAGCVTPRRAARTREWSVSVISDRLDGPHFRHRLPEPGLDAVLERERAGGAAVAGAAHPEQQGTLGDVEVHDLDVPAVGADVGADRVERMLDAGQDLFGGARHLNS